MMFPSEILDGLDLIPTELGFGVLVGAFDKEALALAFCQDGERSMGWRIAERVVAFAVVVTPQDQPFLPNVMASGVILPHGPDTAGGKLGGQLAAICGANC